MTQPIPKLLILLLLVPTFIVVMRSWVKQCSEAAIQRCSVKKVFLKISQNSQENTCARALFFNEVADFRPVTLLKKWLWHMCFPVTFEKFLRTCILIEHFWWILLDIFDKVFVGILVSVRGTVPFICTQ